MLSIYFFFRVNAYISNGLHNNLVDPDGGLNIQKKRLKLGLEKEISPLTDSNFPTDGFEIGISSVPRIGYSQIWKYLIDDIEFKKQLAVEKPIVKGYNFYKSGKVLGLYSKAESGVFYVKSQVMPSYSTRGPVYAVKIILQANSEIEKAYCPCPAGNDGRCNHLAATLFAMEDTCKKTITTEDNTPCTSKPCTWSVPKKRKQEPTTIQSLKFVKHVWGKKEKLAQSPSSSATDTARHCQQQQSADFEGLLAKITKIEKKTGKKIGLSLIIPQQLPEMSRTVIEDENEEPSANKWDIVSPIKCAPLSMCDIEQKSQRSKIRLYDSVKDKKQISEETKNQHQTKTWFDVRKPRITASKCKRCLLRQTTSPTKAISEVLQYNERITTKAMRDGIESESQIIHEFENETGNKVNKSGFVISDSHPFLGASPDGIIDDSNIIEVKKIVVKEGESHEDAMCRLGIYKKHGNELQINKKHTYYYQIQQQLFCTQSNNCHFLVLSNIGTHRETVPFDSSFWNEVLPKLEQFYFENIFPELVYPRILHGETRWNKDVQFPRSS